MEEDPRFPNRKKRIDLDMTALGKPVGTDQPASDGEPTEEPRLPVNAYSVVESPQKTIADQLKERTEYKEDPRFPNRKKRIDLDMTALGKPVGVDKPASEGEAADEPQLPVNVYNIVESAQKTKEDELKERAELYSFRESIPEANRASVEAPAYIPIAESPVYHAPAGEGEKPKEPIQKLAGSMTKVFIAISVGFVILIGIAIVAALWTPNNPEGRYDLGSVTSDAVGLKGHLFTQWDKQLNYRLSIEPSDPDRKAAFALAVASSPHPLSVEIHLQDSQGFVLCSKEILLKYDARNAIEIAPPSPAQGGKTDAQAPSGAQPAQTTDPAQAEAQEAAREKGKDIFKNQVGPDGQVASIGAQGEIPCTARGYEKAAAWSFSAGFPTIAEQDQLMEHQQEKVNGVHPAAAEIVSIRKRAAAKAAQKVVPFSIEGDDSIVDFDASRGTIETTSGKVFFIDKASGPISDPRWQEYPVEIHYRCDQSAECVLMHHGAGALHVRLRR